MSDRLDTLMERRENGIKRESICVPYSLGFFYIGLVDKDQAFLWLSTTAEETIDPNGVFFGQIRNGPAFIPIRDSLNCRRSYISETNHPASPQKRLSWRKFSSTTY
jgi:hypothetical protein